MFKFLVAYALMTHVFAHAASLLNSAEIRCISNIRVKYPAMSKITDLRESGKNPKEYVGDGDSITFIDHQKPWGIVFKHGTGDCLAGCTQNNWYYFTCEPTSGVIFKVEEQKEGKFHLWGIPARYPVSAFESILDIESALSSSKWWIRLHALVAYSTLLEVSHRSPHFGPHFREDEFNIFLKLWTEAQPLRAKIIKSMKRLKTDSDAFVAHRAKTCLRLLENNEKHPNRLSYPEFARPYPELTDKGPKYIYSLEYSECYR